MSVTPARAVTSSRRARISPATATSRSCSEIPSSTARPGGSTPHASPTTRSTPA
jgi:hypothetical protein